MTEAASHRTPRKVLFPELLVKNRPKSGRSQNRSRVIGAVISIDIVLLLALLVLVLLRYYI